MFGDSEVSKIFCGNTLVWQRVKTKTLADYAITTEADIVTDAIELHPPVYTPDRSSRALGYLKINSSSSTSLALLSDDNSAPTIYVPSRCDVYQNGVLLPKSSIYYLVGYNEAIGYECGMNGTYLYSYINGDMKTFQGAVGRDPYINSDGYVSMSNWSGKLTKSFTNGSGTDIPVYSAEALVCIQKYNDAIGEIVEIE